MSEERALLDVDGVCSDFIEGVERALDHKFLGTERENEDVLKVVPPNLRDRLYKVLAEPDFWLNLKVIEGAKEGVKYLEDLGFSIVWVTSPWVSCESWAPARREWLNRHFGLDEKGHEYRPRSDKENVDGSFLIDDRPENITAWLSAHPTKRAFIYDAPYNRHFTEVPRFTWKKVRSLI